MIRGDLAKSPVEQMQALVNGVFIPVLRNPNNSSAWPAVVSEDVINHAQALRSTTEVLCGRMKGEMPLPMPMGTEVIDMQLSAEEAHAAASAASAASGGENGEINGDAGANGHVEAAAPGPAPAELVAGKALVHAIESAVIEWTRQIRDVLRRDSAQPLLDGFNPGPLVECEFWSAKKKNLESLDGQLKSEKMRRMQAILEKAESSYAASLQELVDSVSDALAEAQDIVKYLEPLRGFLESFEGCEFSAMAQQMRSIMRCIHLIWVHCASYGTARRIVVLLRELANQMVDNLREHLEPRTLFSQEVEEGIEKPRVALEVLEECERVFEETRNAINAEARDGGDGAPQPWEFESALIFKRLHRYRDRTVKIHDIFVAAMDFIKLEKVELSSEKHYLQVQALYNQHASVWETLGKRTNDEGYDCFNPDVPDFDQEHAAYMAMAADYDRKLSAVAIQCFERAVGLEGAFKLIIGFQGLLDRPAIAEEVSQVYPGLVKMYEDDLDMIKTIFDQQKSVPHLGKNMPKTAGSLKMCGELRRRADTPRQTFEHFEHVYFHDAEADRVYAKHDELLRLIGAYESELFEAWAASVGPESVTNLQQPLLSRDAETRLLTVNFAPQLVAVLREVKYFQDVTLPGTEVPQSAADIFERNEKFRQQLGNLDIAVTEYNRIQETVLDVEEPLIRHELEAVDRTLETGLQQYDWNNPNCDTYCRELKDTIENLSNRLQTAKSLIESMLKEMATWYEEPLLQRDSKTGLLPVADRAKVMQTAVERVRKGSAFCKDVVAQCHQQFRAPEGDASGWHEDWDAYVSYLDQLVLDGLYNVVHVSVAYMLDRMDSKATGSKARPLQEGRMMLIQPNICFRPGMTEKDPDPSLMSQNLAILGDFFAVGECVERLNAKNERSYRADLEAMPELQELREELDSKVTAAIFHAGEHEANLREKYEHFWLDSPEDFLKSFLKYGRVVKPEELEEAADAGEPIEEQPPTLEQFKEKIDYYNNVAEEVNGLQDSLVFDQWLIVSCTAFKSELYNTIKKWSYTLLEHLQSHVITSLDDLQKFVKSAQSGLSDSPVEGDYDKLVVVMGLLNAVQERHEATDAMFAPDSTPTFMGATATYVTFQNMTVAVCSGKMCINRSARP